MSRTRSPQYPAIGLQEAIEKIELVYNKDYQNPISKDLIAKHLGYNGLNGTSLTILSSLSKYGLLEGRGGDSKVSDLAVKIIAHPLGDPERQAALEEAASKPELFNELDNRFQNGKVSDQAIRSYLLTKKFIPSAANAVVKAYRETKDCLQSDQTFGLANNDTISNTVNETNPFALNLSTDKILHSKSSTINTRQTVFALAEGDVTISFPAKLSIESVEDLDGYLKIFLSKAKRESLKKEDSSHENFGDLL